MSTSKKTSAAGLIIAKLETHDLFMTCSFYCFTNVTHSWVSTLQKGSESDSNNAP